MERNNNNRAEGKACKRDYGYGDTIYCPKKAVHISINEQPKENWGMGEQKKTIY